MAGRGSLARMMPYGDANAIVMDMARQVLPVVGDTPVLAGVCGTEPFRQMPAFLHEVRRAGFSGVQNFPTVGLIDGTLRAGLEETGMGYQLEVEMVRLAHELDLLTAPYVFNEDEARAMADAGADVLVPHMGTDDRRSDRRPHRADPRPSRLPGPGAARCRPRGQPRDPLSLSWRTDRRAGRRSVRDREHERDRRLLRRLQHGAPAGGSRDDREHEALQVHPDPGVNMNGRFITQADIVRDTFDWRQSGWISRPSLTGRTLCASWT
jgi:hypothetical protein